MDTLSITVITCFNWDLSTHHRETSLHGKTSERKLIINKYVKNIRSLWNICLWNFLLICFDWRRNAHKTSKVLGICCFEYTHQLYSPRVFIESTWIYFLLLRFHFEQRTHRKRQIAKKNANKTSKIPMRKPTITNWFACKYKRERETSHNNSKQRW